MIARIDAYEELRQANPLPSEDVPSLDEPAARQMLELILSSENQHRRLVLRRAQLVVVLAVGVAGALIVGVMLAGHNGTGLKRLARGLQPPPTLAQPLGPAGTETSLGDATNTLGARLVLPNLPLVNSSNLGSVWTRTAPGGEKDVAVTYPEAGIIIQYDRPVPYPEPPAAMYQTEATQHPNSKDVVHLNAVSALATQQDSDQLGTGFGSVEFVMGGTRIAVLGHSDESTLENIAQSIVEQASPQ
jgi:hypothetical protein